MGQSLILLRVKCFRGSSDVNLGCYETNELGKINLIPYQTVLEYYQSTRDILQSYEQDADIYARWKHTKNLFFCHVIMFFYWVN